MINIENIFTVKNEDLARLNPQEAVYFFSELLYAEARSIEIPIGNINISSRIYVPDKGVDATVEINENLTQSRLIKDGLTSYQIKASASFKPWQPAQIKRELFKKNNPNKNSLGNSIRDCLDKNGTYILVCFKQDLVNGQHRMAVENLVNYFKQCGYQNPRVEVWSQNNLISFIKIFPSLALKVNGRGTLRFQTHKSWSQEAEMKREFKAGQAQKDFISSTQNELRKNNEATHIHVWGEPGIGKTRLVLESTRVEDLQSLVIYCDSAIKFRDSDLMNEILRDDNQFYTILVIDECNPDSRSYIWNKFKYLGPRIKFISIYSDYDETSGNVKYFYVPPLDEEQVSNIIQVYNIPKDQSNRWVEYCSGSPRVAHVIGQNLKNNPEDLLKSPDTVNVWDKYLVGVDDPNSQHLKQRQLILRHIALFKRFGYRQPVINEAKAIAKIVKEADPQITWIRFQEIIKNLREQKILQGEYTLYITPKLLHIKLWTDWWDIYGSAFNYEDFIKDLPAKLIEWFNEMFKYAKESEVASQISKELLGNPGPFQNNDYLKTKHGAKFFLALTEADPKSALKYLNKTVGTWSKDELLKFTTGRREVVWALEKIAVWRDLFSDAARLLLALGEAENENISNNASGVFAGLFSLERGRVAPTEASPQERFPILKEVLESDSKNKRLLALSACNQALESEHFVRMVGAERQGLKMEPQLWIPKTWGELFDAYKQVWQFLCKKLDSLAEEEQQKAVDILLKRSRGLLRIYSYNLADMVIDTLNELVEKPFVDKKRILTEVIRILKYDYKKLPQQIRKHLEQIKDKLTGSDFQSLMKRYVGMYLWEDEYDEKGDIVDKTKLQIEKLAKQAVENKDLLQKELDWLVTAEAQNGYRFGYELGNKDKDFSFLPELIEAQRRAIDNTSIYFLGGYFRALFERDQHKWEIQLDALTKDKKMNLWIPELTWRSGISDQAALRILSLAKKDIVVINDFRIFGIGSVIRELSEDIFKKWIKYLLSSSDINAISIALDLYYFFYIYKDIKQTLPEKLTLNLLTHYLLFQKPEEGRRNQMDEYHWTDIGKVFIQHYPERSLEIANKMLEHFGEDGTIFDGFHSKTQSVLNEITQKYPKEIWKLITSYLGPPIDSRAFNIKGWLSGGEFYEAKEGALNFIPLEKIWEWVDEDVEKHAWYLAYFVPKKLFREKGIICLAREVLIRYGDREDVRSNFYSNYFTEGYWGSRSSYYMDKKNELLEFRKNETNENVIKWIDECIESINRNIERARIEEERGEF